MFVFNLKINSKKLLKLFLIILAIIAIILFIISVFNIFKTIYTNDDLNSTVNKTSAGAVQYMKIARVTNISDAIEKLKQLGLWICATDIHTDKYYYNQDLTGPLGIVIGNEGKGISEKVRKNCDFAIKIPMKGKIESLNAAVSTGIVVYEAVKQRNKK